MVPPRGEQKASKVSANVDNVISTGTAENDGLIKLGATVTGVGAVTSSYSVNVNASSYSSGYSPWGHGLLDGCRTKTT